MPATAMNNTEQVPAPIETPATMLQATPNQSVFVTSGAFEHGQRVAIMLSKSELIPKAFQNNVPNVMIALEMANRVGASPLMVMQNLYIVHGKPSWSSSFIIAALNASKKFSPLRFDLAGEGADYGCQAWAIELATSERLEGPRVTMGMADSEGWISKTGSKWKTMPDLMLRYRAATFFGRLYAPEILMGIQTQEEVHDITPVQQVSHESKVAAAAAARLDLTAKTTDDADNV